MKNRIINSLLLVVILMSWGCSKGEDDKSIDDLKVSLEYSGLYLAERVQIEFSIISGNGQYDVFSSDKTAASTSIAENVVTVKFHKHAEVDIIITDGANESLTIPMKCLSDEITASAIYLNLRKGQTYILSLRSGGYYILTSDNEYVESSIEGKDLHITAIREGETRLRVVDANGQPVDILLRIGNPDPSQVSSEVDYNWDSGNLNFPVGRDQLTRIHLRWAKGDVRGFGWSASHDYGRIINLASDDEYPILEIVTSSSFSWASPETKHFDIEDEQGKKLTIIIQLTK